MTRIFQPHEKIHRDSWMIQWWTTSQICFIFLSTTEGSSPRHEHIRIDSSSSQLQTMLSGRSDWTRSMLFSIESWRFLTASGWNRSDKCSAAVRYSEFLIVPRERPSAMMIGPVERWSPLHCPRRNDLDAVRSVLRERRIVRISLVSVQIRPSLFGPSRCSLISVLPYFGPFSFRPFFLWLRFSH